MRTHFKKIGLKKAISIFKNKNFNYKILEENLIRLGRYFIEPSFILKNILSNRSRLDGIYSILLIRSGISIIAVLRYKKVLDYKIIKKYTVRKTQGKSQDKHLKTKGKSRLGSRIRLRNLRLFIKETNEVVNEFINTYKLNFIFLGIPKNRKSIIKDIKINFIKIPFHFNKPSLVEVKKIVNKSYYSVIRFN